MSGPLAYLITFTCYGERMHGDDRGSVDRSRGELRHGPVEPNSYRERRERLNLKGRAVRLGPIQRATAARTILDVCVHKGWQLHCANVRTNHVHAVVSAECAPEVVMNALKAWVTRRLRERRLVDATARLWTRHGSTRYLWEEQDLIDALAYVYEGQGDDLGGVISGG